MNQTLKLFSFECVDILLRNLSFRLEETYVVFFRDNDATQQVILYNSEKLVWGFKENYIFSGGDQESFSEFETLTELIKEKLIPSFPEIPDTHVKNIFTLWTKGWTFILSETEEQINLKFSKGDKYFFYPLTTKVTTSVGDFKFDQYKTVHLFSSIDVYDYSCRKDGEHCSDSIFLKHLLEI